LKLAGSLPPDQSRINRGIEGQTEGLL
jgi:hypothetical protein